METSIHNVNKIEITEPKQLFREGISKTHTLRISIKTKDGEKLEIVCFGNCKEDLLIN